MTLQRSQLSTRAKISIGIGAALILALITTGAAIGIPYMNAKHAYDDARTAYDTAYAQLQEVVAEGETLVPECEEHNQLMLDPELAKLQDGMESPCLHFNTWLSNAKLPASEPVKGSRHAYETATKALTYDTGVLTQHQENLEKAITETRTGLAAFATKYREHIEPSITEYEQESAADRSEAARYADVISDTGLIPALNDKLDALDTAISNYHALDQDTKVGDLRDAYEAIVAAAGFEDEAFMLVLSALPAEQAQAAAQSLSTTTSTSGTTGATRASKRAAALPQASASSSHNNTSTSSPSSKTTGSTSSSDSKANTGSTGGSSSYQGGSWAPSDTWFDVDAEGMTDDGGACFEEGEGGMWRQVPCD